MACLLAEHVWYDMLTVLRFPRAIDPPPEAAADDMQHSAVEQPHTSHHQQTPTHTTTKDWAAALSACRASPIYLVPCSLT